MSQIDRRAFLLRAVGASSAAATLGSSMWQGAGAAPAVPGASPYGPLLGPDGNGLMLPAGFRSRVIARSGEPVPGTGYVWPRSPDGGAVFTASGGGWIYVANSEEPSQRGGASAVRFGPDGSIAEAYPILQGTTGNCAGGPTPWGTWLSCEETHAATHVGEGQVWECDPTRAGQGVARPALGRFNHEAAAVDPIGQRVYLTEDRDDGLFYRFTPDHWPDLSSGLLEAAVVAPTGPASWVPVPDPAATAATIRSQLPQATRFNRGEGCWHDSGSIYFVTTGDTRVWVHDVAAQTFTVLYDASDHVTPPLLGVDNVVVSAAQDVYVAEDGGEMKIVMISRERVVAPVVRYPGNPGSEMTGVAFDPSGSRLYFSSQRGPAPRGPGITFEVSGPFRPATAVDPPVVPASAAVPAPPATAPAPIGPTDAAAAPTTTTALAQLQARASAPPKPASPSTSPSPVPLAFVAAGLTGGVWAALWRFRRTRADGDHHRDHDRDHSVLPGGGAAPG
jgi:hypothetical protein